MDFLSVIAPYALIFMLGMLGVSILSITVFGLKNVINRKHKIQQIAFIFIPVLVFAIAYMVTGFMGIAAINTLLIMIGLMFLGILLSGSRSLISNF